jgi:hypothetical protein
MTDTNPSLNIAIIGPRSSWETDEAIGDLLERLTGEAIGAIVLNEQDSDPKFTALRDSIKAKRVGGLAVVNYSYGYEEELDLSPDLRVIAAAKKANEAALPIFVNIMPTMGGLDFEDLEGPAPDLIVSGNNVEIIKNRLEVGVA